MRNPSLNSSGASPFPTDSNGNYPLRVQEHETPQHEATEQEVPQQTPRYSAFSKRKKQLIVLAA